MADVLEFSDFKKVDIRIGTITNCESVEGSTKLLKLQVNFGELGQRQIVSGIAMWYQPEDLEGLQTTFVFNLKARTIMGMESQGMLLAIDFGDSKKPELLLPKNAVPNGSGAI